jgi:hypothetical protein
MARSLLIRIARESTSLCGKWFDFAKNGLTLIDRGLKIERLGTVDSFRPLDRLIIERATATAVPQASSGSVLSGAFLAGGRTED